MTGNCRCSVLKRMMSELKVCGLRLRVRLLSVVLLRMFAPGHLIRWVISEAFYRQLEIALQPLALVLVGEISHSDICWRSNIVRHKASRKFLESTNDSFLT